MTKEAGEGGDASEGKILVIRGGAIGDFILTLPAIRLLQEGLPQTALEIMGYDAIIALARASGYCRATRSIEYGAMAPFFARRGELDPGLSAYFAGFDLVVSYLYDPDDHFRDNLKRAGVESLVACSHRVDPRGEPAARQLAKPLESLALFLEDGSDVPRLELGGESAMEAAGLWEGEGPVIGLHPGSGSPFKNWDLGRWREVMRRLHAEDPAIRFLVSTGEAEEASVAEFLRGIEEEGLPVTMANRLPLPVLGAALARCCLYMGHDSGISHLAAAVGTPSVVLFGPTASAVWAPPHEHVTVLEHPSGLLEGIEVEEVVAAAVDRMASGRMK